MEDAYISSLVDKYASQQWCDGFYLGLTLGICMGAVGTMVLTLILGHK
jgi:hypothetical protein